MAEINYEILGRKVAEIYPDITKELVKTPTISDVSLLTEIYHQQFSVRSDAKSTNPAPKPVTCPDELTA